MTQNATPDQQLKPLSPEWFAMSREYVKLANNPQATQMLEMLEELTAQIPMVDEVEVMKNYTCDTNCRTCHGRGRLGINRIASKEGGSFYQLQLCHCAKPAESEYARIEKTLLAKFRSMQMADMEIFRSLYRHSFFGGIKYTAAGVKMKVEKLLQRIKTAVHWPFGKGGVVPQKGKQA